MCSESLLGSGTRLDRPGTEFNYAPFCILQLRAALHFRDRGIGSARRMPMPFP
jgi:hypothetical protein